MKKFTEAKLEQAFIDLIATKGIAHTNGKTLTRDSQEVLIKEDLIAYLSDRYQDINLSEIDSIIKRLMSYPSSDLYESNKKIMTLISDGFLFKREDASKKDLLIELIDYSDNDKNYYRFVNQLEIIGSELRIPDGIVYINGMPLVVFEFKSAIRENATIHDAFKQLTVRYERDIPELFKYNALCIISDGVNNKAGSFFASYDFFYAWRKITGEETINSEGIDSAYSLIHGLFNKKRLRDVIQNFIYLPDSSKHDMKIVCRYPQYYAARKLYENIKIHQKPLGDGKGGTYFGATGCGKSFTMLFLARLLMRSQHFSNPTLIIITDRTDLDDQLSDQFTNAKQYIGDENIISVESRKDLKQFLNNRKSGGVFLTTIHKFTETLDTLSDRNNIICISDEAHRSQINLDQKVTTSSKGVKKTFGFAKYLHDSLPNATFVGFTGTPIDATLDVFGEIVDSYTMTESVKDEITVKIVYEGRAAKVLLKNAELEKIEKYYAQCADDGASEYQVEESKKASANMNAIIGDPDRLKAVAEDFVNHYDTRVSEGSTVKGKAMFVCSSRMIAYNLYTEIIALRPSWAEVKAKDENSRLTEREAKDVKSMAKVKMIMTRHRDDPKELYNMLGTKQYRKELDKQFKNGKSNFKIAIVVDMWLTGFDVPFLDSIYIDKPLQKHSLIQTISRVNRKFEGKEKGLVIDYIGIKKAMNMALKKYNKIDEQNFEDIQESIVVVIDQIDIIEKIFYRFNNDKYFSGTPLEQLETLNRAVEYVQVDKKTEYRFMQRMKRMKSAYDICSGSDVFSEDERDLIHYYLAIRSILHKLTSGGAPDTSQMNRKVREMIKDAIESEGVEEIFKLGENAEGELDIFDDSYLAKLDKLKMPNTKFKLLQKMLERAIMDFKAVNKVMGVDFSKQFKLIVEKYNERKENDVLKGVVLEEFTDEIINLYEAMKKEKASYKELGIDFEEKAFYDILLSIAKKYDFSYPEDKLKELAKEVKKEVDDVAKYTDWNNKPSLQAELKVHLILLLHRYGYPPAANDEVYKEIFEQAENFKRNLNR